MERPDPNEVLEFKITRQQAADLGSILSVGLHVIKNPDNLRPSEISSATLMRAVSNLARVTSINDLTDNLYETKVLDVIDELAPITQTLSNETFKLHAPLDQIEKLLFFTSTNSG